jgi:hypothetical protein
MIRLSSLSETLGDALIKHLNQGITIIIERDQIVLRDKNKNYTLMLGLGPDKFAPFIKFDILYDIKLRLFIDINKHLIRDILEICDDFILNNLLMLKHDYNLNFVYDFKLNVMLVNSLNSKQILVKEVNRKFHQVNHNKVMHNTLLKIQQNLGQHLSHGQNVVNYRNLESLNKVIKKLFKVKINELDPGLLSFKDFKLMLIVELDPKLIRDLSLVLELD